MHNRLYNEYFEWMYCLVCNEQYLNTLSFRKLLTHLYRAEFIYILDMDCNRAQDGVDFRYRFGYENGYSRNDIDKYLKSMPCSVLEMMVALAFNGEERIMDDPELGDRTGQWFWAMIVSLGLGGMDNSNYNKKYVDKCIHRFLYRKYKSNGEGGLFTISNLSIDFRKEEIWCQFMWYLSDTLDD